MNFDDYVSLLLGILFLILFVFVFARVSHKLRKGGGSLTTFMLGTTDAFYNKDKKKAADEIVEQQAAKKLNHLDSGDLKSTN
jgi:hypothetical protein